MAQCLVEVGFCKNGEDGVSTFANRMTQGIFVGHHDRKGAVLCITKKRVMRGKSWTRHTLSDAWNATDWDNLCGTPRQMVALGVRLTEKVTADKEGAGPRLPSIIVERRFYELSADIEAHVQTEGCPGCAALASHGRAIKPHNDEGRERIRTSIQRTMTGRAMMNAYKDRIAETERMNEKKRAPETDGGSTDGRTRREERGAAHVPGAADVPMDGVQWVLCTPQLHDGFKNRASGMERRQISRRSTPDA